jgi:hypothetical protein
MENEANALAGNLMRQFRYKHPEIYTGVAVNGNLI